VGLVRCIQKDLWGYGFRRKAMIDKLIMFYVLWRHRSIGAKRNLVKRILEDVPALVRTDIVAELLPPGKHVHSNPRAAK
jgi:hypothetical protein